MHINYRPPYYKGGKGRNYRPPYYKGGKGRNYMARHAMQLTCHRPLCYVFHPIRLHTNAPTFLIWYKIAGKCIFLSKSNSHYI